MNRKLRILLSAALALLLAFPGAGLCEEIETIVTVVPAP